MNEYLDEGVLRCVSSVNSPFHERRSFLVLCGLFSSGVLEMLVTVFLLELNGLFILKSEKSVVLKK